MFVQCFQIVSNTHILYKASLPSLSTVTQSKELLKCSLLVGTNPESFSHPEESCPIMEWWRKINKMNNQSKGKVHAKKVPSNIWVMSTP